VYTSDRQSNVVPSRQKCSNVLGKKHFSNFVTCTKKLLRKTCKFGHNTVINSQVLVCNNITLRLIIIYPVIATIILYPAATGYRMSTLRYQ